MGVIAWMDIVVVGMATSVVAEWMVGLVETVEMPNLVVGLVVVSTYVPSCKVPTCWLAK